ncbi:hypothetical protein HMPREF3036_01797 [Sutterella sp. KLE1602]|nr:hypothetical protein HMPREF3036_01797 [Sutterella sp. KLE1602]
MERFVRMIASTFNYASFRALVVHAEDCFSCFPQSFALNAFDIRQDFFSKANLQ